MSHADSALTIARGLVADAVWHGDRCTWLGAGPRSRAGRIETVVRPVGPELYGGTAGIGLVLAEIAAAAGDPGCARAAAGALRQSLARAPDIGRRDLPGLFTGLPGIAVAAARAGRLLGDESLCDDARAVALRIRPERLDGTGHDVIAGRAGAVVGLLRLSVLLAQPELGERAAALGHRIVATAAAHGAWSWPASGRDAEVSPVGLGHGVAGVAWALIELWAATGDPAFRDAADAAFDEEERRFDGRIGNWRRLREDVDRTTTEMTARESSISWCHGAPGIGLTRLRAWQVTREPARREQAEAAARATRRWVGAALESGRGGFTLCHGVPGNAEMLTVLERGGCEAASGAARLAADVADWGAREFIAGDLRWPDADSPSLMTGRAGIARFYLGRHDPGLGSLLLLDGAYVTAFAAFTRP